MALEEVNVAAVTLKLPPFWPADAQMWFAQVEAQFSTRGITAQRTKFDYVVASLAPEFATEVRDLILSPPDERAYDNLKEELIRRTAASEQKRLQQLLNAEDLGDRKPTQLLRRMQQLLGEKAIDESLLRELFLQRLPANVRMVLASTRDTVALNDLAQLADKIAEVAMPSVCAVNTPSLASEVEQLRAEVASLKQAIKSLSQTTARRQRSTSRNRSPTPPQAPTDLCWYHRTFGDAAKKCHTPCSRQGNEPASH